MEKLVRTRSLALSRRRFLRGAGVAMALPWLESVPVWGATAAGGKPTGASAFPKRFAAVFMANGVNAKHWWAKPGATPGAGLELGKSLGPMAPLKAKMNLVGGLYNEAATKVGIHPPQTGNLLSGAQLQKGAELKGDISVDQMLANHLGQDTVQPSMVLGCETPTTGYHETNYSLAYSSHISWQNATTPVPMEQYPALAFDALFDNRSGKRNQSILDLVKEQAATLHGQVSAADRAKLDEYLTSVREVEKRIAGPKRKEGAQAEANKALAAAPMKRPADGLPEDIREHMRLMCDLVALGFQTDHTRVATLLLCRDLSGLTYPFLDIRKAHHPASHADASDDYEKITRYYVGHFAYLASRLDAMKEGPGSVLDNSCLMFVSNMWSGSKHDATKLPVLLAGSLGGTLKTGRALDYEAKGDENRKMCSLYLSIMDRMGVVLPRFGDAQTRLAGI